MRGLVGLLALAADDLGSPVQPDQSINTRELNTPQTASGFYHNASPTCCLSGVYMCQNGWIYQVNMDQMRARGHGCDPPWGLIATSRSGYPCYCC
ncbi:hypothetical protein LMH87_009323 [Akanthomyces muscarius]|uniref:Uncharacterized protein n=1 Tax=Akanthomyces muscarius TaxID=2231603 RepID=A0A9W8UKW8_AKAMU|nr:hypothetical protein LMH87_009323 [Akanthomyces muscarius]KAJ4152803.1 hypothetical protein LMH87_009323 [Akanthomyces muscarius]